MSGFAGIPANGWMFSMICLIIFGTLFIIASLHHTWRKDYVPLYLAQKKEDEKDGDS